MPIGKMMRSNNVHQGGMSSFQLGPGVISPVVKYLLIINGAVFLIQIISNVFLASVLGLVPARFIGEFPKYIFQPLTYMFLHANFLHIFFNMFTLWMFGTEIEYSWGSKEFLKFYLLCGIGGALFSLVFNPNMTYPIIGASGAIYGVLVAYWLMFPGRILLLFFILPMQVRWAIPLFALMNFFASGPNVAHLAHLGGAVVGLAYIKLDWRLLRISKWLRSFRTTRQTAKLERRRQKAEEIMKRVDEILDKINQVGLENISSDDKRFLEEASQILSRNDK